MVATIGNVIKRNLKEIPYFFERKNRTHASMPLEKVLSYLAHDIITPVSALSLMTELPSGLEEKNHESLKRSVMQIREYVTLMRELLEQSRIPRLIDVNAEIKKCLNLLRHAALDKNIAIELIEFNQIKTTILPFYLYQIAVNLVTNAIEASSNSKILVILRKSGSNLVLECKDFGNSSASNKQKPGHGFGLESVRHIVQDVLNGAFEMESEQSEGLLCRCTLPLRTE